MREWAANWLLFSPLALCLCWNSQQTTAAAVSGLCTLGAQPVVCVCVLFVFVYNIVVGSALHEDQTKRAHRENARTHRHPNPRQLVPQKSLMGKVGNWVRCTMAAGLRTDGAYEQTGFAKLHLLLLYNGSCYKPSHCNPPAGAKFL